MMGTDGPGPFPGADGFVKMWSDFASSMAKAGLMFSPASSPPQIAREIRSAMLEAWAEYCDQFMRSGEFREMTKQSLAASVEARRQMNDFFGRMQHEFQGASRQDVDQLMLSLRHIERRLVDGMERLSARLDEVAERLAKLEQSPARSAEPQAANASEGEP
jgi:hypothetical protein